MDLAKEVSRDAARGVERRQVGAGRRAMRHAAATSTSRPHVVAIDYGAKRNIFRNLVEAGARVTVLPATATLRRGDGARARRLLPLQRPRRSGRDRRICGAGDPAAARHRQAAVRHLPRPPDCSALAVGGKTAKMFQGHRGANHPVKRLADGAVEITSMNHGFAVERDGLPGQRPRNPRQPVRRQQLRARADRQAGVQRPVPPRGEPGPAGQLLSVREVRGDDAVSRTGYRRQLCSRRVILASPPAPRRATA